MLKRRRTYRFKRNALFSSTARRRLKLRNIHRKVMLRHRLFALQQMAELSQGEAS